jgi:hypothetical protein
MPEVRKLFFSELTAQGAQMVICADPRIPDFPNKEVFGGKVMHSGEFKSGKEFKGKKVGQNHFYLQWKLAIDHFEKRLSLLVPVQVH